MIEKPLRVGIIGMGGFAGEHHRAMLELERERACRVVCACDPQIDSFREKMDHWAFADRGVRVFSDYLQMLDACREELDLVTVPTPVSLHAPMHRACVERGLACYLEKPPTLYYAELEEMLGVEARAVKQTQVAFNFIVETTRQALKQRILGGEFGGVRRVCFLGLWPRSSTYFTRAPWAGRLKLNGRPVLDSCIGNAMAHFLHNLHFWAGQEALFSWEDVLSVQAELYRAHAIEGMDTVFARGACANRIELQVAASHACDGAHLHREWVECERATITYITGDLYRIEWKDGKQETASVSKQDLLIKNLRAYFRYLHGETLRPLTRLVDSRPFVHFNDLMYLASRRITTISSEDLRRSPAQDGQGEYVAIEGLAEACDKFFAAGHFPSQQGATWGTPGGQASLHDLPQLLPLVDLLSEQRDFKT